jgi:hypothetical protein
MASPGIDIIRADDIGVYQAKVIKANSSVNLISWLKENGFQFQSTDLPVLDDYIRRDWCFVVAAVKPEKLMAEETYFGGLIAPIILRFKTSIPIYPLALTSTIGTDTQLVIYILNQVRVQCRNRLPMTFAGNHSLFAGSWAEVSQHKQVFKGLEETNLTYLTKFKGTLTPAQMRKDLEFEAAPDNKPFRENIYVW